MLPDKSDEEIIALYKSGERDAFRYLIEKYTASIYNFTARLAGRENAPDLVQEIFIKVWRKIDRFDAEKAGFKTWLFTIARNTAFDFLRRKKIPTFTETFDEQEEESFVETIPDENLLPDEALQKLQEAEALNKLLEKLPVNYKTILVLHYQADLTFEEIGKILNKPLNTVKSYHHRAITELKKKMRII